MRTRLTIDDGLLRQKALNSGKTNLRLWSVVLGLVRISTQPRQPHL
jgi:hypothetical protein